MSIPHEMCPSCEYSDSIDQFDRKSKGDKIMFVCPKCTNVFEYNSSVRKTEAYGEEVNPNNWDHY